MNFRLNSNRLLAIMIMFMFVFGQVFLPVPIAEAAPNEITITGNGVNNPITISAEELDVLNDVYGIRSLYSTINTWPTKNWYVGEGIPLEKLLEIADIKDEATIIKVSSKDGFSTIFTKKDLLENDRYLFPNFKENHEYFGYIPGSAEGAEAVPAIVALVSIDDENYDWMNSKDGIRLMFGQRWITEQTNHAYAKHTNKIEVLTTPVQKWNNPTSSHPSGEYPVGTVIKLESQFNDADKVYYTTDGSDPTIESPMYNWIASRWWSQRSDELEDINKPIELTQDTIIKAKTIGLGREDSDIVTFEYTVLLNSPPELVADSTDNLIGEAIDITFIDDEDWRNAITNIKVNGTNTTQYAITEGNININKNAFKAGINSIIIEATGYEDAIIEQEIFVLKIIGDGITSPITYSKEDLESMPKVNATFSAINSYPTKKMTSINGIKWSDLLNGIEIKPEANFINIKSSDGGSFGFTKKELLEDTRYYFPGLRENDPNAGYIPGSPEGKVEIEPILSTDNDSFPRLYFGQRWITEQTHTYTPKYVQTIEITTKDLDKWESPTVDVPVGVVPIGTKVKLSTTDMNGDNIHYTIDGTDPTGESTMYNYVKKQWWNNYGSNLENINKPIEITKDTVIKAIAIGFGKQDSDIVTFEYKISAEAYTATFAVTPEGAAIVVKDSEGAVVEPEQDGTYNLVAGEYSYTVSKEGYVTKDGTFAISNEDKTITVELEEVVVEPETYTATFIVTPEGAAIVVKDSEGAVVEPEQDGTYNLVAGEYSYTVSKEGYVTKSGTFTIADSDETITVDLKEETIDILYDGTVTLTSGETFNVIAYNSNLSYTVNQNTPLGALQATATAGGFTYDITDKNYEESGALLLDNIGSYHYVKGGSKWCAYVNDAYKDGYNNTANALNLIELVDGDKVEFYYVAGISDATDVNAVKAAATAAVKTQVTISSTPTDPTDWTLQLLGARNHNVDKNYFENGLACASSSHHVTWIDDDGNIWEGVPLWLLVGMVDDNPDMGDYHINFNDQLAAEGYKVKVISGDGYSAELDSTDIARNNNYIVANTLNGEPLPLKTDSGKDCWPLHLKGSATSKGQQVGNIVKIELINLPKPDLPIPELRIVKYGEDHTTILEELTITYDFMEENFEVIGDGTTVYKFQGVTFDPEDIWDENEVGLGGYKIENAVKGTRISDLCDLVGGMGAGTDIVLVAKDGWQTKLPYSSIYPDPSVQARQGDAIIAWWADGEYVPDYKDGMRLFFTPDDHVYSQMDMRETLPEDYWHYYGADGVMYPSCAGLSAKYITELRIYTVPQGDWALELDGQDIGGLYSNVSKTYFESALTCTMGANHKTTYTDSKNRVWEGMPLWLLVGFVDDADQHSGNAFNRELAMTGYQVVIAADDGHSVVIDSKDIDRNNDYIIANSLDGALIPESNDSWPLRLVGPNVSGKDSIGRIASIKLLSSTPVEPDKPQYKVLPAEDTAYTIGTTPDGINTMIVNVGNDGLKYFTVNITPVKSHDGNETVVFTHLRNGVQLQLNAVVADFDEVGTAQAGFNVQPGDVVKVYIVDQLTNDVGQNPIILQ